eukprot:8978098-Pyramimonas_sp.AAC.1
MIAYGPPIHSPSSAARPCPPQHVNERLAKGAARLISCLAAWHRTNRLRQPRKMVANGPASYPLETSPQTGRERSRAQPPGGSFQGC